MTAVVADIDRLALSRRLAGERRPACAPADGAIVRRIAVTQQIHASTDALTARERAVAVREMQTWTTGDLIDEAAHILAVLEHRMGEQ